MYAQQNSDNKTMTWPRSCTSWCIHKGVKLCTADEKKRSFVLSELWTPDSYQNKSDISHIASWSGMTSWKMKKNEGQISFISEWLSVSQPVNYFQVGCFSATVSSHWEELKHVFPHYAPQLHVEFIKTLLLFCSLHVDIGLVKPSNCHSCLSWLFSEQLVNILQLCFVWQSCQNLITHNSHGKPTFEFYWSGWLKITA